MDRNKANNHQKEISLYSLRVDENKGIYKYNRMSKGKHMKKPLVWGGLKFESNEEMAKFTKSSPQLIRHYLKKDMPFYTQCIDYDFTR